MIAAVPTLLVLVDGDNPQRGVAMLKNCTQKFRCALGKGGATPNKREGDGATPLGRFPLREAFYRADREARPDTALPLHAIAPQDGWCDAPDAPDYNRKVRLPHPHRHEMLWREGHVYDLIVVVGYNDAPPVAGCGSAIFIHLMRDDYAPTEGCIAFAREDLLRILAQLDSESTIEITKRV